VVEIGPLRLGNDDEEGVMGQTEYFSIRVRPIDVTSHERAEQIREAIVMALEALGVQSEVSVSKVREMEWIP
jgi:hypothetical protein